MPQPSENTLAIAFANREEPKTGKTLSPGLHKRLVAYATVAGAGVAGCAAHAEAEVIYTPVHSYVNLQYPLDLNHDGITDFVISSSDYSGAGEVKVTPGVKGNRMAATHESCAFVEGGAAALHAGALIGRGLSFQAKASCMAYALTSTGYYQGAWLEVKDGYLGLAFLIDGKIHYGWARLHVNHHFAFCGCIAGIDGYAYETVPGKAIIAGDTGQATEASLEPASLGILALGAPGLGVWRTGQTENRRSPIPSRGTSNLAFHAWKS
jgi:hypothetical protein